MNSGTVLSRKLLICITVHTQGAYNDHYFFENWRWWQKAYWWYVKLNHLNLSEFIRNTILEKIEDEMPMSEQFVKELLKAKEDAKNERLFTLEEACKKLGIWCIKFNFPVLL